MVTRSVISSETAMFVMEMVTRLFVLAMIAISSRIMNRTTVGKLRAPNKQHVKFAGQTMVMHSVISLETATFVMITDMRRCAREMVAISSPNMNCTTVAKQLAQKRRFARSAADDTARRWDIGWVMTGNMTQGSTGRPA